MFAAHSGIFYEIYTCARVYAREPILYYVRADARKAWTQPMGEHSRGGWLWALIARGSRAHQALERRPRCSLVGGYRNKKAREEGIPLRALIKGLIMFF